MTGFFRQLAERTLSSVPELHPRIAASAAPVEASFLADAPPPARVAPNVGPSNQRPVADRIAQLTQEDAHSTPPASAFESAKPYAPPSMHGADQPPRIADAVEEGEQAQNRSAADESQDVRGEETHPVFPSERSMRRTSPREMTQRPPVQPLASSTRTIARTKHPQPISARTRTHDSQRTRTEAEPAPEVHIHIGRIEIKAVAPSNPVKRESGSTKKPMSLDEYLQHRTRKLP